MTEALERDYVLGTHDPEIARLGLQHAVWRERALGAWRRAGVKRGRTVVDLGCGPGYATLDLSEIVGPEGRVIAVDRSRRFLDVLERAAAARGVTNIEVIESDVGDLELPEGVADVIWCRWLLIFASDPEGVIARVAPALAPNGAFACHEYVDYGSFTLHPPSPAQQALVAAIEKSWAAHGGDPDVGLRLPKAFAANGLRTEILDPVVHAIRPDDFVWSWVSAFLQSGPDRLVELGYMSSEDADQLRADLAERESDPHALMITPMVLEAIARKPA